MRSTAFRSLQADREFVALLGPSGCGKSTLLKLIAGLIPSIERRDPGQRGSRISGPTPSIGIVFQSPLLMAWRTVLQEHVAPDRITRSSASPIIAATAHELIRLVGLERLRGRSDRISCPAACSSASRCAAR